MASAAAVEGVSGAIGGCVALIATYPLMTISTLQATRSKTASSNNVSLVVPVKKQSGTISDLTEVISTSGWTGLYRGLKPAILGTAASQGCYFYLYSILREAAVKRKAPVPGQRKVGEENDIGVGTSLLVAFLAGCGNVLITNPIWTIATRMQAHQKGTVGGDKMESSTGAVKVAIELFQESGILGFWKGCLPALVMVSNPTVQYALYEYLTSHLSAFKRRRTGLLRTAQKPSPGEIFLLSALAKLGATVITYPLLLVKARLMSASRHTEHDRRYKGTMHAIFKIWRDEGPFGFYKGMRAKIVQSVLAAALLFSIKEEIARTARVLVPVRAIQ